jgi:hypothetical protein
MCHAGDCICFEGFYGHRCGTAPGSAVAETGASCDPKTQTGCTVCDACCRSYLADGGACSACVAAECGASAGGSSLPSEDSPNTAQSGAPFEAPETRRPPTPTPNSGAVVPANEPAQTHVQHPSTAAAAAPPRDDQRTVSTADASDASGLLFILVSATLLRGCCGWTRRRARKRGGAALPLSTSTTSLGGIGLRRSRRGARDGYDRVALQSPQVFNDAATWPASSPRGEPSKSRAAVPARRGVRVHFDANGSSGGTTPPDHSKTASKRRRRGPALMELVQMSREKVQLQLTEMGAARAGRAQVGGRG